MNRHQLAHRVIDGYNRLTNPPPLDTWSDRRLRLECAVIMTTRRGWSDLVRGTGAFILVNLVSRSGPGSWCLSGVLWCLYLTPTLRCYLSSKRSLLRLRAKGGVRDVYMAAIHGKGRRRYAEALAVSAERVSTKIMLAGCEHRHMPLCRHDLDDMGFASPHELRAYLLADTPA